MTIGSRVILVEQGPNGPKRTNIIGVIVAEGILADSPGQTSWYKVRWDADVRMDSPCWVHRTNLEILR